MRKVKIPPAILKNHRNAFEAYIEKGLKGLASEFKRNKPYREYLRCLMIDPVDPDKKQSIVVRNIRALGMVVQAVDSVKAAYPKLDWHQLEERLKSIFNYGSCFVKGNNPKQWDTFQYIQGMKKAGLVYCPYCNSHKLEAYETSDGKRHKGPLDHFYDKARYPYLALSICNLIPVCDQCNREKHAAVASLKTHSHPYYDDFHELVVFSVEGDALEALYSGQAQCVVNLSSTHKKRSSAAESLARDVELVKRYNDEDAGRVAHQVLRKAVMYRDGMVMDYLRLANEKHMALADVYGDEFGVKPDGSDINERQYGKLRNDLMPANLK